MEQMAFETLEQLKQSLDAKLGLTSTLEKDSRGRERILAYCSPTGVPLIDFETTQGPEGWKFYTFFTRIKELFGLNEVEEE